MKVGEAIRMIEQDGWRQFKHSSKAGRVTIAGKLSDDLAPGTLNSILKQAGLKLMRYAVVIEKSEGNYSAYVPDLPGCVATGATVVDVEQEIRSAIRFHIEGLREDGLPVPTPTSSVEYVDA